MMHLLLKEFHSYGFKNLTGHDPYPHQMKTYETLAKIICPLPLWERVRVRGKSFILKAPTGSGKSEGG